MLFSQTDIFYLFQDIQNSKNSSLKKLTLWNKSGRHTEKSHTQIEASMHIIHFYSRIRMLSYELSPAGLACKQGTLSSTNMQTGTCTKEGVYKKQVLNSRECSKQVFH